MSNKIEENGCVRGCCKVFVYILLFPIIATLWLIRKLFFWWMPTESDWGWWY